MRALLQRHAALIYVGGGLALLAGTAIALWAASLAGCAIGGVLAATGLAAMGTTSRSVGA